MDCEYQSLVLVAIGVGSESAKKEGEYSLCWAKNDPPWRPRKFLILSVRAGVGDSGDWWTGRLSAQGE